jgi:hypothetical protein
VLGASAAPCSPAPLLLLLPPTRLIVEACVASFSLPAPLCYASYAPAAFFSLCCCRRRCLSLLLPPPLSAASLMCAHVVARVVYIPLSVVFVAGARPSLLPCGAQQAGVYTHV